MNEQIQNNPGRFIGALVLSAFGGYLASYWTRRVFEDSTWTVLALLCAACLAAGALYRYWRSPQVNRSPEQEARRRLLRIQFCAVVLVECLAIVLLAQVLSRIGMSEWTGAGLLTIVGLHFFPLAKIIGYRPYYWTGIALTLIALGFALLSPSGPTDPRMALSAGVTLWATAALILFA